MARSSIVESMARSPIAEPMASASEGKRPRPTWLDCRSSNQWLDRRSPNRRPRPLKAKGPDQHGSIVDRRINGSITDRRNRRPQPLKAKGPDQHGSIADRQIYDSVVGLIVESPNQRLNLRLDRRRHIRFYDGDRRGRISTMAPTSEGKGLRLMRLANLPT